jgi:7-cyano-7-deazaguanine synthase
MESTQFVNHAVLLSGGIDSMALSYLLRPSVAITVDYGQAAAEAEITASNVLCRGLEIRHEIIRADCSAVGFGNMIGACSSEKKDTHAAVAFAPTPEWWPFRNQLVVTLAAARAVQVGGIKELILGTVKTDREHRDGLPEFVELLNRLLRMQEGEIGVQAPAMNISSAELVRASKIPTSLLAWSHSCHSSILACGSCRGCLKHMQVFHEIGES